MSCRICEGKTQNHMFQEQMFGSGDTFGYEECMECGCIQIEEYPLSMDKYYPPNYYSVSDAIPYKSSIQTLFHRFKGFSAFTLKWYQLGLGHPSTKEYYSKYFETWGLTPWSKIHDVGAGSGFFLHQLSKLGFTNLSGSDPYLDQDLFLHNEIPIRKVPVNEIEGSFDLITLNHVFEHLPNQLNTLTSLKNYLNPKGAILLRIPIAGEAWNRFGKNWVQLDAPRHFYVHSEQSFRILAEKAGLDILDVTYDSTSFQFWGSIQYEKGVALDAANSYAQNPDKSLFTAEEIASMEREAKKLNALGSGDQAAFLVTPAK